MKRWLGNRRLQLVLAGSVLVLVPTTFTVFPELTSNPVWVRLLVVGGWLALAGFAVHASVRQAEDVSGIVETLAEEMGRERRLAGRMALRSLLAVNDLARQGVELRLYIVDENEVLHPVAGHNLDEAEAWPAGSGATGTAYETGEYVPVSPPQIADASYGLTPEQQQLYATLTAVAAMPIKDDVGQPFGVLTGSTEAPIGAAVLLGQAGQKELFGLATACGRVLLDLVGLAELANLLENVGDDGGTNEEV